jgi:hypothetical protein
MNQDSERPSPATIVVWNDGYCVICDTLYLNLSKDTTVNKITCYVLNYTQSLIPVINKLSEQYHKDNSPISVYVDGMPVADSLFELPTLFVANFRPK